MYSIVYSSSDQFIPNIHSPVQSVVDLKAFPCQGLIKLSKSKEIYKEVWESSKRGRKEIEMGGSQER